MKSSIRTRRTVVTLVAIAAAGLLAAVPASAGTGQSAGGSRATGYNAIPSSVNGNVPSEGFEATGTSEFGDEVVLDKAGKIQTMTVLMSSWGCQTGHWDSGDCQTTKGATFSVALTFKVYADNGGTKGNLLAQQSTTVAMPYRPSASSNCQGDDLGKWFNTTDKTCYNGFPQAVTMRFDGQSLPSSVIWTVEYNTSTAGPSPIGPTDCYGTAAGCGYDSLNVGTFSAPNAPYAGADVDGDTVFRDGALESGWTGFRPMAGIVVK
jgi:hypothetical protein